MEWVIVGDTDKYKDCLILCGCTTWEMACKVLNKVLTSPQYEQERNEYKNIHIAEVAAKDCWWRDGVD